MSVFEGVMFVFEGPVRDLEFSNLVVDTETGQAWL